MASLQNRAQPYYGADQNRPGERRKAGDNDRRRSYRKTGFYLCRHIYSSPPLIHTMKREHRLSPIWYNLNVNGS